MKPHRRILVLLHRYAGLLLGAFLLLEALTGCAIVFEEEIDSLLNPHLHPARQEAPEIPLDQVLRQASEATGAGWKPLAVRFPGAESAAYVILFRGETKPGAGILLRQVFVNAHSAEVLGQRGANDTVLQILRHLHANLYLGEMGALLLLTATFGFLALGLTGPFLWQPKGWRPADWFKVNWSANPLRRYYDLHKVCGFWLLPLLLVSAFTSIYMLKPPLTEAAVDSVFPLKAWHVPQPELQPKVQPGLQADNLSLAQVAALAQAHRPEARLANLRFPGTPSKPYVVELFAPNEINDGRSGSIELSVDPRAGVVLQETTLADYSAGDHIMYWQYPLHNGHAFGLTGRILVFVGGACLALLCLTSFYLWIKKKKSSIEAQRRKRSRRSNITRSAESKINEPDRHTV